MNAALRLAGRFIAILVLVAAIAAFAVFVRVVVWMEDLAPSDEERERALFYYRAMDLTVEFTRLRDADGTRAEYAEAVSAESGVVLDFQETPNRLVIAVELVSSPSEDFVQGELRQCYRFTIDEAQPAATDFSEVPCYPIAEPTG